MEEYDGRVDFGVTKKSKEQDQQERANLCLDLVRQMTPLANEAESLLKSAKNWGFVNIFGGGTWASLTKHSKLDRVAQLMAQINAYLRQLNKLAKAELIPANFPEENDNTGKMADIFINNLAANSFTQVSIIDLLDKIRGFQRQLVFMKENMLGLIKENDTP